jgi:hypothetical protein
MKRIVAGALLLAALAISITVLVHGAGTDPNCGTASIEVRPEACPTAAAQAPTLAPPRERPTPAATMLSQFQPQGQVLYVTVEAEAVVAHGQP